MGSFLFYSAVFGFALGIAMRSFFGFHLAEISLLCVTSFAIALIWRRRNAVSPAPYLLGLTVFLFLFALGGLRMEWATWTERISSFEAQVGARIQFEGVVAREPDARKNTIQLYIETGEEMVLVMAPQHSDVWYGDTVRVSGLLQEPSSFETELGRTFNYRGFLQARGVEYVVAFAEVEKIGTGNKNPIIGFLLSAKRAFIERIEKVIPQPQAGLAEGLLLGVKQALGDDLEASFRKTGIMHIVVLSGYNVMLVIVFVMYVLSFALPLRARLWFGLLAIVLFAAMVGFSATVVRASIMASLILVAKQIGRTYAVIRALMITGIAMLLLNPYLLAFDVGFQLSFIATLGLILLSPIVEKYVHFMPTAIGLREFLTATIATQIFVTPILLYQIGEFSVVSVFVNVLVLPMVPVAMLLTFITGMIGFFSISLSAPFGYLAYVSLSYILLVAQFFAELPFASFVVPAFPFAVVVLAYLFFAWTVWRVHASKTQIDQFSGWTIVEEESIAKGTAGSRSDPAVPVPAFFK